MLEGWYCRTMNEQSRQQSAAGSSTGDGDANESNLDHDGDTSTSDDDSGDEASSTQNIDYRALYNGLKKKLKFLIYENEYFQENLRINQRRLLKVSRDRSFLLDRLLQYERPELTSSESDDTDSSDDSRVEVAPKKRKLDPATGNHVSLKSPIQRKKKPGPKKQIPQQILLQQQAILQRQRQIQAQAQLAAQPEAQRQARAQQLVCATNDAIDADGINGIHNDNASQEGHLTPEEVERHLQSRQALLEVVPEGELPSEMFNNNPSSDSNDQMIDTSPSNLGD